MSEKEFDNNVATTANHQQKSTTWVQAAFNYQEAYSSEIELAIEDNLAIDYAAIKRLLPQTELLIIPQAVLEEDILA